MKTLQVNCNKKNNNQTKFCAKTVTISNLNLLPPKCADIITEAKPYLFEIGGSMTHEDAEKLAKIVKIR